MQFRVRSTEWTTSDPHPCSLLPTHPLTPPSPTRCTARSAVPFRLGCSSVGANRPVTPVSYVKSHEEKGGVAPQLSVSLLPERLGSSNRLVFDFLYLHYITCVGTEKVEWWWSCKFSRCCRFQSPVLCSEFQGRYRYYLSTRLRQQAFKSFTVPHSSCHPALYLVTS